MTLKTTHWDAADYLTDYERIAAYLEAALDDITRAKIWLQEPTGT